MALSGSTGLQNPRVSVFQYVNSSVTHALCSWLVVTAESDYVYRPFRTIWFTMALIDASAFKLSMANAAMFLAQRKNPEGFRYEKCSESLEYYGQCISEVTRRLGNRSDCVSEGVITTILGLVCHDVRDPPI